MRYWMAVLIPAGFVIAVFSVLAILTSLAEGWSANSQAALAGVLVWWGHYWWMIGAVLASVCLIVATVSDAKAPAKKKPRA